MEKGWFEELGIAFDPEPYGNIPSTENLVQALASGACDVASASAVFMLPSVKDVPPFKWWVHGDMFQGYALMAQPDAGYKSVDEFIAEGKSPDEAMKLAVEQMKGKRFAYPPEAAIKGFIDLALSKAGMSLEDVTSIVAEDAKTWAMMIADQADFQVGGVPSRLTLETRGFKPIITSQNLAQFAKPSADSVELRSVFQDGWGSMDSWIDANYDTMMRMASVMFRIAQFQNTNRDEALAIHVPFLNSAAGTDITPETAVVVYESLDPFIPFDGQAAWYLDENNPLNYDYVTGSYIKLWEEKGLFAPGEIKVSDISMAKEVYQEFLDLKAEADKLFPEAEAAIAEAKEAGKDTAQAQELLDKARYWYDAFDYLDAVTWATSAIEWAQYEASQ
ncbi:MAG: ABC transporter substrate-binding protein [Caldilineaceae bacterium]|nr:ABC transporter substrate-binding protein [Caldilineaceae bacterium]